MIRHGLHGNLCNPCLKTGEKGVKIPKNGFFRRKMQKNEKKLLKNLVEPEIVCTFATAYEK